MTRLAHIKKSRLLVGLIWLIALLGLLGWIGWQGWGVRDVLAQIYRFIIHNPYAPLVYILIYILRTLTFFPAMWLTIAAGSLFGFIPGLIFGLIGENASAQAAYLVARYFRRENDKPKDEADQNPRIASFRKLLLRQSFPTVLVLRASYLPFDLVNYACGLLRVPWLGYTAGSIIGMLPPMVTFVSFGATINLSRLLRMEHFSPSELIDARQLWISVGLVIASAVIAVIASRRRKALARQQS